MLNMTLMYVNQIQTNISSPADDESTAFCTTTLRLGNDEMNDSELDLMEYDISDMLGKFYPQLGFDPKLVREHLPEFLANIGVDE